MSFFNLDVLELIPVFQRECTDLMSELDGYLEQIEENQNINSDRINGIFRVVHTIKSSSAMMGLQELSVCTHHLEDLFLMFRNQISLCEQDEKRIVKVMYEYADYVRDEIDKMAEENYTPTPITNLKKTIDADIAYFHEKAQGKEKISEEIPSRSVKLHVEFKRSCPMANVRAVLLLNQMKPFCTSLKWIPEDLKSKDAHEIIKKQGLDVFVVTEQLDKGKRVFERSPYVDCVLIEQPQEEKGRNDEVSSEKNLIKHTDKTRSTSTTKFCNLSWESVMKLQKLTEELIISHTLLENKVTKMGNAREIEGVTQSLKRTLTELEEVVSTAALTPVSSVKTQLNRIVRDICKKENKKVSFVIKGEEIEADKNLIDTILNPLMHLIRNAIDHGIETEEERVRKGKNPCGQVEMSVSIQESTLIFSVRDDGSGMDSDIILETALRKKLLHKDPKSYSREEILNLIFMPGFSTTKIANEFSGRGVGMDVVRNTIDALGGILRVESEVGQGSTFIMQVPVSLTSVESISFFVRDTICLLPLAVIERVYSLKEVHDKIITIEGKKFFQGSAMIPVLYMSDVFGFTRSVCDEENMMVLKGIREQVCIVTGAVEGEQTAVTKKLPHIFREKFVNKTGISGCVVIDDGELGFMLNIEKLVEMNREV